MSCQIIREDEQGNEVERYWVETEVLRIGSDARCQIAIEGLPDYAATLHYSDGAYQLFNRCNLSLELNGSRLDPEGSAFWPERAALRFNSGVALRLSFPKGDPSPQPRPAQNSYYDFDDVEPEPSEDLATSSISDWPDESPAEDRSMSPQSIKNAVQFSVIGLCLLGVVVLLAMKDRVQGPAAVAPALSFDQIIVGLMDAEPDDESLGTARGMLQDARRFAVAGRSEEALTTFTKVRDLLLARKVQQREPNGVIDVEVEALNYVLLQIANPGR